jgi:excisionase family DNA binding protein
MAGAHFQRKKLENAGGIADAPSGVVSTARREGHPELAEGAREIMTRAEVAALLRCSEPHVLVLVEREGLPAFRLGKLWRFRCSEVVAWCERKTNGSRSP